MDLLIWRCVGFVFNAVPPNDEETHQDAAEAEGLFGGS